MSGTTTDVYAYTDRALTALRREMVRRFAPFRGMLAMDEVNILTRAKELYTELDKDARTVFLRIARMEYPKADRYWLEERLNDYDLVTGYNYVHEVERKAARFGEALVAAMAAKRSASDVVDTSLRLWSNMVTQYAVEITDTARLDAMAADGVDEVEWVSRVDASRCLVCKKRHGTVYPIDRVPPKPHIGCRCYLIPR